MIWYSNKKTLEDTWEFILINKCHDLSTLKLQIANFISETLH